MKPLAIENFDFSDAFILDPIGGKYGLTFAKFISVETNKSLSPIRKDGDLKVFMNKNDGKHSFLLAKPLTRQTKNSLRNWKMCFQDCRVKLYLALNLNISS